MLGVYGKDGGKKRKLLRDFVLLEFFSHSLQCGKFGMFYFVFQHLGVGIGRVSACFSGASKG